METYCKKKSCRKYVASTEKGLEQWSAKTIKKLQKKGRDIPAYHCIKFLKEKPSKKLLEYLKNTVCLIPERITFKEWANRPRRTITFPPNLIIHKVNLKEL